MTSTEVINWDEALDQCGDDEEFLMELLGDLREEIESQISKIESQISKIEAIVRVPTTAPYQKIMRAAHVIKGAAANLMCPHLRQTSMELELAATAAHDRDPEAQLPDTKDIIRSCHNEMMNAVENFNVFLSNILDG